MAGVKAVTAGRLPGPTRSYYYGHIWHGAGAGKAGCFAATDVLHLNSCCGVAKGSG